jgi:hypothetical protein
MSMTWRATYHRPYLGDMFGRDRMCVQTVAFGPPDENYAVLDEMSKQLPLSSFQKLGLSAANLRTAMTSLSSSLTTLRTSAGGAGNGMTFRNLGAPENRQAAFERQAPGHRLINARKTGEHCSNSGCEVVGHLKDFKICPQCVIARYCGRECYVEDWNAGGHKETCGTVNASFARTGTAAVWPGRTCSPHQAEALNSIKEGWQMC